MKNYTVAVIAIDLSDDSKVYDVKLTDPSGGETLFHAVTQQDAEALALTLSCAIGMHTNDVCVEQF